MSEEQTQVLEEVFQSPEALEQAMLEKEAAVQPVDGNHADKAALMFKMQLPRFHALVKELSMKQLRRVLMNVASFPLADDRFKPQSELEKKAAYFFNELVTEKTVMQLYLEQEKAMKAMEEEQKTKVEEKGESDGKS